MSDMLLDRRMQHFMAVFETGTLHLASRRLGLTQPALSASLRKLETELGATLFDRTPHGMAKTKSARILYRYAATARQSGRFALSEIGGLNEGVSGRLRLGAGIAWTTTVLPGVMDAMHERFPGLDLDLLSGIGDYLAAQLVDGELDAILAGGVIPALDHPDFAAVHMTNLPMLAVADAGADLARKGEVATADLAEAAWIGFLGDENIVAATARYMAERGLPLPRFVMRTNSPTALAAFQRDTGFVSVLIAPLAQAMRQQGFAVLNLAEPLWSMPVSFHTRTAVRAAPPIVAFRILMQKAIDGLGAGNDR